MKNYCNLETMRKFITLMFTFICTISVFAQKFETHILYLPDDGSVTKTVKIKKSSHFSIKKDGHFEWAESEITKGSVKFSATANTEKKDRSCCFILCDKNSNPTDTIKIVQGGKQITTSSNSVTKVVGTSTNNTARVQCAARTQKGTRCSRMAEAGSIYCWQHKK